MLSIIIPALNESQRLPAYLKEIRCYAATNLHYEVVVVDDGSTDGMLGLITQLYSDWPELHVIAHDRNRGKGAAIRTGIRAARGSIVLLADADGATSIEYEKRLRHAVNAGASIACGSRKVASDDDVVRTRSFIRFVSGELFSYLVRILVPTGVKDTQCGFKMLTRDAAIHLANATREEGFVFDVELLATARALGYPIAEVPISWRDIPCGNVRVLRDGAAMCFALYRIRRNVASCRSTACSPGNSAFIPEAVKPRRTGAPGSVERPGRA